MEFKKAKNKVQNILICILFFISYYLFFLSLEKCTEGEDKCCLKLQWIKVKIIEELISCAITIILFEFIIFKKISKFHLLHFTIFFLSSYIYSNGIEFDDHGYYNIYFFFIIVITILILFSILLIILRKKKKIILLCIISLIISFYYLNTFIYSFIDCKEWPFGLNNTSIDNDKKKYGCQIKIPKACPYKIGKYILDKNTFLSIDCSKKGENSRKNLLQVSKSPYINEKTLHIGYPIVNKHEKLFSSSNFEFLKKYVYSNLVDMDNYSLIQSLKIEKPEVSVDFSENKIGQIKINLNFNQTLSDERRKLEKNVNPYSKNILFIYIDSVSRAYSIRQLRKTLSFFEKFISYRGNHNKKFESENFHSFQFFKYHSFKYFTIGNYPILFYGNNRNRKNKLITSTLKRNGYITGYSADNCFLDFTNSFHDFSFDDVYDHQYVICDPNKLLASSKLNCFYGKIHLEFMYEYINQFWRLYKDNRKFAVILTNFAHEGSLEMLKYIDKIIYKNLNDLFNDNLFKETSIFLVSDHGVSVPSIYYVNNFFNYEKELPMFYLIVNDKNESYAKQYNNIYKNQQVFITAYDIFNTIVHLVYGDKYGSNETKYIINTKYGKSLFDEINPMNRSPKIYEGMVKNICT